MQETQCPQCGEWLGVPPEFADRPIRCGACGRIIPPHERSGSAPSPPPPPTYRGAPRFPDDDSPSPRPSGPRFPDRDDDRDDQPRRKGGGLWWVWLLLAVGGFGGCCCCGGVGLLSLANQWKPYTAPKAAFTADLPGEPVETTRAFKWNDDKEGTAYEFLALQPLQGQAFAVHYADIPKSAKWNRPSDDLLLTLAVNHIKTTTTNFTPKSEAPAKVGEYKARDIEGSVTDPKLGMLQVCVRVVIVGDRLYILYAAGKDKTKLTPDKERFFDSFKPADPKETGKEKPADPKEK